MIDPNLAIPSCKKLFAIELFVFKLVGLSSFEEAFNTNNCKTKKKDLKYWEIIFIIAAFWPISFLLISLIQTVPIYFGVNFSMTCYSISVLFSMTIVQIKLIRLWSCRLKFYKLFETLNSIWEENITNRIDLKNQIIEIIGKSKPLQRFYVIIGLALCFCYTLRPYIVVLKTYMSLSENETMTYTELAYAGVNYPIKTDTLTNYLLLLAIENQISFFAGIYFILCDLLFITLTTIITVNFTVLADEYHNIFEIYLTTNKNLETINRIIRRHCLLLSLCRTITHLFSPIVLFTVIFNGIDICCTIFAFKQDYAAGEAKISLARNLPHTITLIFQILVYCNCAHIATERSKSLREAIYNSSWMNGDKKIIKAVITIMINSQNEYKFTPYGIFILNRQQLTQIFNTTSSYFMLLRSFA
ncbi:odorant receptor 47a-like [Cotesia glomerata]|uniref:odorant receptor 47a-like n=1 Tax=Cotesia glomerata TaxID=32391 RepID=UPI001D02C099|nr:odorant receptor 47a-like [Cotesia glomerata]